MTADVRLERNLAAYPWLHLGQATLFWLPVFVLYFSSLLPPEQVLQLEAIYYAGVVLLEVPSGWLSDRVGRKQALLLSALGWSAGSAILAFGTDFATLAVGQLGLAVGMAFFSGTDSSLLYDTLKSLGREQELVDRQGRAQSLGWATLAMSAGVGGVFGGIDLRLTYGLSAAGAVIGLVAAAAVVEPPRQRRAPGPWRHAGQIASRWRADAVLRWVLVYVIAMTVFNHVPYELLQPWLDQLVSGATWGELALAPPASGAVLCATMLLAAVAARQVGPVARALGSPRTLVLGMVLQAVVMAAMAVTIHPVVVPILLLRSLPGAWMGPLVAQLVHPRVASDQRATYLSIQSLAGRLAFAGALGVASTWVGADDGWTPEAIRALLVPFGVAATISAAALAIAVPHALCHSKE